MPPRRNVRDDIAHLETCQLASSHRDARTAECTNNVKRENMRQLEQLKPPNQDYRFPPPNCRFFFEGATLCTLLYYTEAPLQGGVRLNTVVCRTYCCFESRTFSLEMETQVESAVGLC